MDKKCSSKKAFIEEVKNDWYDICIASKALIFIGLVILIITIFIIFFKQSGPSLDKIEVIFRSSIASIFGFLLSSKMSSNKNIKQKELLSRDCDEEIKEYNFNCGNIIQIILASILCLICIITVFISYVLKIDIDLSALSQFRDLICSSIGFLIGESKGNGKS